MRPFMTQVNLTDLTYRARKRICECDIPCKKGITISFHNDGNIVCWGDSKLMMYDLVKVMDGGGYTSWTAQEEGFIIQHFKKKGMYRGFNRFIADGLGKSYQSVKSKTSKMRKEGVLKDEDIISEPET